jgi:hypothetical protein
VGSFGSFHLIVHPCVHGIGFSALVGVLLAGVGVGVGGGWVEHRKPEARVVVGVSCVGVCLRGCGGLVRCWVLRRHPCVWVFFRAGPAAGI